ncbi:MAG: phosphoribosylamine--glycine ligase [Alphaproteobacteria bacterium]|jgi:phosphoribosylamine--glycine ligase|nr:phosphoribosylamine--glycine ligase [Alphaproteobacteria bacterium]
MKILVVGSGAREHALCWSIAASPLCDALYCAPGNAGIANEATCVPIPMSDLDGIVDFARANAIDFVVVGPEDPLVAGLVDQLDAAGIKSFGPNAAAAALEGSKSFTKGLCERHAIPTAGFKHFTALDPALAYVREQGAPIVIKADGLAAGKGVTVAMTLAEAEAALVAALRDDAFGAAGSEVVIEEFMEGEEASFFALVDGTHALPLAGAQDHKRVGDGDTGPNTGGMGAYSPAPVLDQAMADRVMAEIIMPTVEGMAKEGTPFKGVLYAGLMITETGPRLIEYNARFGDPECQVLMARLKSDILPALIACHDGQLSSVDLRWDDGAAICVVLATKGYPGAYGKGSVIKGLDDAETDNAITVFHAGTALDEHGQVTANGGRVLGVTALGADIAAARDRAYAAVERIDWPDGFCRGDIAWRAIDRST